MSWIAVGIGAAVGAASGAAIGSKKGGDDVWKGALLGGALGAAGGGIGGAAFGGAGAAAEGGIGAGAVEGGLGAGAMEGGSGLALGGAGLETGGAMGLGGAELGGAGAMGQAGTGILSSGQLAGGAAGSSAFGSAAPTYSLAGTQGVGAGGAGFGGTGTAGFGSGAGFGNVAPAALPGSGASFGTTGGAAVGEVGGFAPQAATQVGSEAAKTAGTEAAKQGSKTFLDEYGTKLAFTGGTLGLGALLNQQNKQYGVPAQEDYTGPLSQLKYDPARYTPTQATPNVYQARYAQGGIAALADGGMDSMNPMQNAIYPQSQQEHTNFATSTQYPNSMMSAMNADYDARTNPTTGQEMPMGMASGGVARFGIGGDIAGAVRGMQPGGFGGDYANKVYATTHPGGFMGDLQEQIVPGGTVGTVLDASVPGREEYLRRKREHEAQASFATGGGIASLGSYSDGGQLLRGPGDGVSDSIPASIGRKQPARLADGEFVVPARAVSELGNGSTEAGAKQLYSMLDRIQNKRKKGKGLAYQSSPKKMLPA